MFYIALLFLIFLAILAVIIAVQNYGLLLSTNLHLTFLLWSLPGIPVLLLCVLGVFLGGLVLYVIAARAARRDEREIKTLRARIEELENLPAKTPSGGLSSNFAPSVVPLPGFSSGVPQSPVGGPPNQPGPTLKLSGLPNQSASAGPLGASGPGPALKPSGLPNQPASAGLSGPNGPGPANPWQSPANPLQNMPPSASGNALPLPPRPFPPQQQSPAQQQPPQQMGGPRPPFQHP